MGSGAFSATSYARQYQQKAATGTTFAANTQARRTNNFTVPEILDPKLKNKGGPLAGKNIRESRDIMGDLKQSVSVWMDHTGSMAENPAKLQKKLGDLFGMVLRKGYLSNMALQVGCYGDAMTDQAVLEVSQFETDDTKVLTNLDSMLLFGGGGGNGGESQALAWYYMAYHTVTDNWEKRNKKGYAFFICDEISHTITERQVKEFIGDGEPLGPLDNKSLAKKVQEQWEVYIVLIDNLSAEMQGSKKFYSDLFGAKNVLVVEDPDSITETIALAIGVREGAIDNIDDGADDLADAGSNALAIRSATNAVKGLANLASGGAVAKSNGTLNLGGSRAARL